MNQIGAVARTSTKDGLPGFLARTGIAVYKATRLKFDSEGQLVSFYGIGRQIDKSVHQSLMALSLSLSPSLSPNLSLKGREELESLARGCSGSKFFCAPGPAVQGRSSRASSPARPSLDLDHALPSALSPPNKKRITKGGVRGSRVRQCVI